MRVSLCLLGGIVVIAGLSWAAFTYSLFETRLPEGVRIDRITVSKSRQRMVVYDGETRVAEYRVGIGNGIGGPKVQEGDRRTPEGVYRIDSRHPSARFSRFLHISFPNARDRARFREMKRTGGVERHARIGGGVGVHGQPWWADWFPWATTLGATAAGCVSVHNREIQELYTAVVADAEITISP